MEMYYVYYVELRENKNNPAAKYYLPVGIEPRPLPFKRCMLVSEIPIFLVNLRQLDRYMDLDDLV